MGFNSGFKGLMVDARRCQSALRSGSLESRYFVFLRLSLNICRPCTCSLSVSAKGGLSHPRISTAHVNGSHALRRSIIPQNWRICCKFPSGMTISVNYTLTCLDIFMALKPFDSKILQGYLVPWHMRKTALKWIPKQKRARGRPKENWMEGIRKAMNERN